LAVSALILSTLEAGRLATTPTQKLKLSTNAERLNPRAASDVNVPPINMVSHLADQDIEIFARVTGRRFSFDFIQNGLKYLWTVHHLFWIFIPSREMHIPLTPPIKASRCRAAR